MCVIGACKGEVEDSFFDLGTTVGAVGRGGAHLIQKRVSLRGT